ncbi:MAG: trimeric intracellular cation channel family protein [Oscillospiraceae bacterium]|nr:trimeric intracellular cation channel family protein [Oscillospiraceae bacterium]
MSENLLLIFELMGTVAFAVSGAITGLSKKMDIFGVATLGLVTAVGGGVIRDIILGHTPPATFQKPIYALVAIGVSVVIFIPAVRKFLLRKQRVYDAAMLLMDSAGLGIFTVVGIQTAYSANHSFNAFLLIFVGMVTGIGGGVIRDILAGNTPYIFVKHFYASASFIGAVVCILLWEIFGSPAAIYGGAAAVIILRLLAARFRWSLPKADTDFEQ